MSFGAFRRSPLTNESTRVDFYRNALLFASGLVREIDRLSMTPQFSPSVAPLEPLADLFVPRTPMTSMAPSHVLVPLDGSPLADEALTHAVETFDCRVTILNVVTPLDSSMSEGGIFEGDESRLVEARERANELVDAAKRRAAAQDRAVESAIETGDPADTILEFVESHDIDHVVMGGHGGADTDIVQRLLGTVATRVVGEAPVTVTVVR